MLLGAPPRRLTTDSEDNAEAEEKGEDRHEAHLSQQDDVEAAEDGAERELWVGDKLLDLGAGDGYVTKVLEPGVRQVYATETSSVMRKRLRDRGYR